MKKFKYEYSINGTTNNKKAAIERITKILKIDKEDIDELIMALEYLLKGD